MQIPPDYFYTILFGLVFSATLLFLTAAFQLVRHYGKRRELLIRIRDRNVGGIFNDEKVPREKKSSAVAGPLYDLLGKVGRWALRDKAQDPSQGRLKFLRAGFRSAHAPAVYWGTKCLLGLCFAGALLLVRVSSAGFANLTLAVSIGFVAALFGFYLPDIWLHVRIGRRKGGILEALPDALDLLVICVEAGLGLDAAINRVAEEIRLRSGALSEELKLLNLEMMAGKARQEALRNLARRTDLQAVNSLVTLLIQTERFGTSIAQALRVYSEDFRRERYQKAEELAAKVPVKLLFPLIFFVFPSLFVVILGPAAIRVYQVLLQR